ncbi:branched-chain amino acid ABC transporter permease [Paracoccus sp. (in: a-proteobacteria)]|uniref:branched-chain amino acid ABC transporter permease n=1 Tax=Paracoccus sp. TaxID=267 RepID=UPI002AFFC54B|nr:branched-chain amino acid ABC transporter permease [Paracoccus sp. (in: a-proteobacteria)]
MKTVVLVAILAVIACVPFLWGSRYILHIATMTAIMIPMAAGMNIMLKIGQLSLAQAAFMGMGAYASALLTMKLGVPAVLALVIGGILPAIVAGVLGPVFLRIKGVYFVLLTFAFGQIVNLILQDWVSLTGGNSGIYGIPKFSIFGFRLAQVHHYYILALLFAVLVIAVLRRLEKSDVGAILESLNDNEMLSRSLGANALSWRIATFVLSAFIAGISGGIYAFYIGFLSPDPFGFRMVVDLIVMNVVGGVGTIFGPVLGAIFIVPLPELLRDAREYQLLIYAAILIFFILFVRNGIASLLGLNKRGQ